MKTIHRITLIAAAALLGACVAPQPRELPHHYSTDRNGNRIACFTTATANEYECTPVRTARLYDNPYYDPFWPGVSWGMYYGWPGYYPGYGVYPVNPPGPPRHHFLPR